jgi:membrane protease subunit (stomatin/prohibitin family)
VWFVNLITKLNTPWGTTHPIQLEDPKYGLVVPVRAFGQFGFRITQPRRFLEGITGTAKVFTATQITDYFKGLLLQAVNVNLGRAFVQEKISVLEASAHLDALAKHCGEAIKTEFARFGLELVSFFFHSINIPEEDASYQRLKVIKEKAAELKVLGRDIYQFDRSMEVLKTAAANEGGGAGLMQAGVGLAVGAGIGQQMAPQAAQFVTKLPPGATPPLPTVAKFHVAVGNQDIGETELEAIKKLVAEGKVNRTTLVWRDGMAGWQAAETQAELNGLFQANPPPIPPVA